VSTGNRGTEGEDIRPNNFCKKIGNIEPGEKRFIPTDKPGRGRCRGRKNKTRDNSEEVERSPKGEYHRHLLNQAAFGKGREFSFHGDERNPRGRGAKRGGGSFNTKKTSQKLNRPARGKRCLHCIKSRGQKESPEGLEKVKPEMVHWGQTEWVKNAQEKNSSRRGSTTIPLKSQSKTQADAT